MADDEIEHTCLYCGAIWVESYWNIKYMSDTRCIKCGDKNVKKKSVKYEKLDYYSKEPYKKKKDVD